MTTVRITHAPGVGDLLKGMTVHLEDRHAKKLLLEGYAERVVIEPPVVPKAKKAKD